MLTIDAHKVPFGNSKGTVLFTVCLCVLPGIVNKETVDDCRLKVRGVPFSTVSALMC